VGGLKVKIDLHPGKDRQLIALVPREPELAAAA
jgi:hypothetical protein